MKTNLIKLVKFLGFLSVGVLLLYLAFRGMSFESLTNDLKHAKYSWVLLSLVFALIAYISRAIRWRLIIEPLGYKPGLRNTFFALMVGYLANFAFPRIGEITRCATLSKKEKIPVDRLIGTVIVERAIDLLSLLMILVVLVILRFDTYGKFFRENVFLPLGDKISSTFNFTWLVWIILALALSVFLSLYLIFRNRISNMRFVTKIRDLIKGVLEGLKTVYKMKKRWPFIFHTLLIWFMYWMMTWVVVFALPSTSNLKIIDGLFILVIGGLGMSAPVQSGIGAFHWIVSRGLFIVYGISIEKGLVFATIAHESQSLLAISLGIMSFALIFKKRSILNLPIEISSELEGTKTKTA